jgi:RNA polymerase sigma-70 factor (sigma-E family)
VGDDFGEFVVAALPGLLRFGVVLTGSRDGADELVQVALLKTWRRWKHIDHTGPVAYVRRVMVTQHVSRWRRSRHETALPASYDVASSTSASAAYDDRDRMLRALAKLPPRQRAVVVLRYYEDLSEADIAATLGCATGTVKSQAAKALRSLRVVLGEDAIPDLEEARR